METLVGAKVNLSLAVTGRRDGMHTLDMRVCSVSLGDGVRLSEGGARFSFTETPAGFVPALYTPLLERAYALMHGEWGGEYSFTIAKCIPHLAGLGGSSAPVAGMARLWAKARGVTPDPRFLLRLGSDVPYMFRGGDARVRGTGEEVEGLPFEEREVLIVTVEGGVDTAKAYALYDGMCGEERYAHGDGELFFHDLFPAAVRLNPRVGDAVRALRALGVKDAVMTGSGSAVCAFSPAGGLLALQPELSRLGFGCTMTHTVPESAL